MEGSLAREPASEQGPRGLPRRSQRQDPVLLRQPPAATARTAVAATHRRPCEPTEVGKGRGWRWI